MPFIHPTYVYKLNVACNAILKENQIKLEQSVASQKEVIAQQKEDFETILNANKELTELKAKLDKELVALDDKFNKTNASGKKKRYYRPCNCKVKSYTKNY